MTAPSAIETPGLAKLQQWGARTAAESDFCPYEIYVFKATHQGLKGSNQ